MSSNRVGRRMGIMSNEMAAPAEHILVGKPFLTETSRKWAVLVHLHPSSASSTFKTKVVVTDRHGVDHQHMFSASLSKYNAPIAVGFFDLEAHDGTKPTLQQVTVSQVSSDSVSSIQQISPSIRIQAVVFELQDSVPASYDWTTNSPSKGSWPGVFNQGSCGNCFAFSAMVAGSSREGKGQISVRDISCTRQPVCQGGYPDASMNTMATTGYFLDSDYKMSSFSSTPDCGKRPSGKPLIKLDKPKPISHSWTTKNFNNASDNIKLSIQLMLMAYGPMPFSFPESAGFEWHGNHGGTFFSTQCKNKYFDQTANSCCRQNRKKECFLWLFNCVDNSAQCDVQNGGHAVTLVGWATIDGEFAWRMQNSWGSSWYQGGFIYFKAYNNGLSYFNLAVEGNDYGNTVLSHAALGYQAFENPAKHAIWDPVEWVSDANPSDPIPGAPVAVPSAFSRYSLAFWAGTDFQCDALSTVRDDAIACWTKLTANLIQNVLFSPGLVHALEATVQASSVAKNITAYPVGPASSELATLLYDSVINPGKYPSTSLEEQICDTFLKPLLYDCMTPSNPQTQVVGGTLWSLPTTIFPVFAPANTTDVFISIYTDVDSAHHFRWSTQAEGNYEFAGLADVQGMTVLSNDVSGNAPWSFYGYSWSAVLIAGVVVGSVVVIAGIVVLYYCYLRPKWRAEAFHEFESNASAVPESGVIQSNVVGGNDISGINVELQMVENPAIAAFSEN
jgi:C1A family cysteine protease